MEEENRIHSERCDAHSSNNVFEIKSLFQFLDERNSNIFGKHEQFKN